MYCSNCGAQIREGAKFCSECGTTIARGCPNCGAEFAATDKFCAECGHHLQVAPAAAPSPAVAEPTPAEERRFVSALFVDLVGFTPLTEARDSEEVRNMLTTYFDRAREIVDRFGGVIDKYIGDALMAVWGAHTAHEDDAERMVRAGLELIEAVEQLGVEIGTEGLTARGGGLSGEAAVGGDGNTGTGLIIGDIVNIASRLQGAAPAGGLIVGRSAMELAKGAVEFESAGEFELKGVSEPVEAWRAVRVIAGQLGRKGAQDGVLIPPFVGRTDELRLLKDAVHATAREHRSRLVSIVGQGGIGKSRLVGELWNYLDGLSETTYWHQGRSPAYGDGLAFWALGEMVRQRCGIAETDDAHKTRTKLRTTLAEFISDGDDRAWAEPRIEGLLGVADVPPGDRAELFAAWRMLFTSVARRGNTVMVFEDLHWADDGLLDFIEELIAISAKSPILVITLARPELLDRRVGWGSGRTNSMALHLAPLAPTTMEALITSVVPEAPEQMVTGLVDRADGIPLYAVEMLRMLAARGLIEADGANRFRVIGDVAEIEIPDSLQGLVGARIDQLNDAERSVLNDAAVLGQSFTLDGLEVLRRESSIDELATVVEPLVNAEILAVNRDPRSPERGQYQFVQSIIREVAHQRIRKADRLEGHLAVAEYFESLDESELAGIVANHYIEALDAAADGQQRDELRTKAVGSLLIAVDRAAMLQSHAQAVRLSTQGADLATDARLRAEFLMRACTSAFAVLDDRAEEFGRAAIDAFEAVGDAVGVMRASTVLGKIFNDHFRADEAVTVLEDAIIEVDEPAAEHAEAMAQLARSYALNRMYGEALPWCDRALAVAERLDLVPVFTDALITKGVTLGSQFRLREGLLLTEAALALAREHQLTHAKRRALNNIAFLSFSDNLNDPRTSEERLVDAKRIGTPRGIAEASIDHAGTLTWRLQWDEAAELLEQVDYDALADLQFDYDDVVWMRRQLAGEGQDARAFYESAFATRASTDAQMALQEAWQRCLVAYLAGRFEEVFAYADSITEKTPGSFEVWWSLLAGLRLRDAGRIRSLVSTIGAIPYHGRHIDVMRHLARAADAAWSDDDSTARDEFHAAVDLVRVVYSPALRAMVLAEVASLVGRDDLLGYEAGREAYDLVAPVGANGLLELLSDGMFGPEEASIATAG